MPSGKLPFDAKQTAFFVANDTFSNKKVESFKKLINLLYEIRSMPAGKNTKN